MSLALGDASATVRHHLSPVRMAIINKPTNNSAGEDVEIRDASALMVGIQTGEATGEKQYGVSSKNEKRNCLLTQ